MATIETSLTKLLGIKHPIFLAGMNKAAGPKLAAAVTNAGGLGVIGGVGFTPRILKLTIKHLKGALVDKNAPFGVDLLLPKVGGGARATNYDYTKGKLDKLVDIIIEEKARLFVCAIGVPPKRIVDKLHSAGILVMNMVGAPKHVPKALAAGVDLICAQGSEGGGHTGAIATTLLLPKCVDLCRGHYSPLNPSHPVYVVGAGGIYDGRGLAMALSYGAQAVWVGTRFVCSEEAGASIAHKEAILGANYNQVMVTEIYTGRPMRIVTNPYAANWEANRVQLKKKLMKKGQIPYTYDIELFTKKKKAPGKKSSAGSNSEQYKIDYVTAYNAAQPMLSGQAAGAIHEILPARVIVESMVTQAVQVMQENATKIRAKL